MTCREGYNFLGWADGKNATEPDYRGGDTITLTWQNPTKTIYAVWKEKTQPQPDITDPTDFAKTQYVPLQCKDNANHRIEKLLEGLPEDAWEVEWTPGSKEATLKLYPAKIAPLYTMGGEHKAVDESTVTVTLAYTNRWSIAGRIPAIPAIKITCAAPVIPDPTEFIGIKTVPVQCDNKAVHYVEYAIDGLIEKACAELVWSTGSKAATLKLYPEKIAKRFSLLNGTHTAVTTGVVTVKLTYNGGWKIDGTIPVIHVTCAAPEIPDPKTDVRELNIYVKCVTPGVSHSTLDVDLGSLESSSGWTVAWTKPNTTATLTLYPDKIAEHYSKTLPGHTAVSTTAITIGLTYANGKWAADRVLPDIEVKCEPAIPNPTDYVKEQFVTVVCDDKTAHPNIQYLLENLPAGSVDVQWEDGAAKTAKLVLKPDKIAEHYGKSYDAHTAVNSADVEVSLTYVNDAWSLSAAIPDVHVTCKPAQEIPNPKDSFDKLLVNVACNTENSGHDPIEVPLSAVANSVNVRWEPGTATAYITLTPSIFATYYSQHNNGANGAHDPVAPAAVTVEAHYDNEKGWFWTKPTINVKCEPVYTITYNWRGVVKPADVKNVNNPETFTADELPITLKAPDFKNNEWPQKFLNWRDAAGNVVTQITTPGNVELYAYYQFPVRYTVYDENGQKVDELSVTEWYNEDDYKTYNLRSGEQTGHDFDGWYQTTKDFGNTNKRVTKLNMAKKYELVGKLTRKAYIIASDLRINGNTANLADGKTYPWSYRYGDLYGETINYQPMIDALKERAVAVDQGNAPVDAEIKLCFPGSSDRLFNEKILTYGQEGGGWNAGNKNTAPIWGYATTIYAVTFNSDGGSEVAAQRVKYGETLAAFDEPTKDGYKFLGWFTQAGEAFDLSSTITKSMTLTAKWELNLQTVNVVIYRNGDMTKAFKTVALDPQPKGTVIDLTTLNIADYYTANSTGKYDFYGWYNDGKWNNYKANPENPPAGLEKITINGWTNIICMVYDHEKVVVKALYDGSTDVKNAEVLYTTTARKGLNTNEVLNGLELTLDKTGHTHDEWFNDSITYKFGENDTINGWTNAYVKYTRKEYTVTASLFLNGSEEATKDARGVVISRSVKGLYGDPINYDGENGLNAQLKAAALAADAANNPNQDKVDIRICLNDKSDKPFDAETYGQEGYNWRDMQWQENKWIVAYAWAYVDTYYDVTFDVNMEGVTPVDMQTVKCNKTANEPTVPTKEGYKFLGWFEKDAAEPFDFDTTITHKTELTAKWTKLYKIIYHGNGGLLLKDGKTFEHVTSAWLEPGQPTNLKDGVFTREHYTFTGWAISADGEKAYDAKQHNVIFPDTVFDADGNVHLYAAWTAVEYLISVDYRLKDDPAGGNVWVANIKGTVEDDLIEKLNAEVATKNLNDKFVGYTPNFDHWFYASDKSEIPAGTMAIPTGRLPEPNLIMVYLKGTPNEYTVTFDPNGGEVEPTSKTVTFDDTYGELPTPTRTNYNFKGWYLNSTKITADTVVKTAENHTLKAAWSRNYYALTINYVDKKGKPVADSYEASVALGADFSVTSPSVKGYKLKNKDDAVIEGTMPGRNLTIEVVYIKKSTGGSSGTIDSPNKPTTKAPALTLNTDDHFAFINGYPDGSVQPEGNVTRAETAAILYRIMGDACQSYYKTNSSSYSDVARGDWYNTYVATLENAGVIVDTRTNGKFRPNDAITRAELASMIAQFAGLESASAAKFNDVGSRYWAAEEIAIAAKMGWINGYPDGSFRPDRNVTRAELMAMVNRALGRTPKSAGDLLSGMKTWRDNANVNAWYYLDVQEATNDHTYTKSGTHETWKKLL